MRKQTGEKTKWKIIFKIYKRDLKNILHNPIALLITLGLLILPSLYAWVNIIACWDPYGNTNGIKVAVVNLDQGAELQGKTIRAGDEIVKQLQANDDIGWQFVENETAEYGLTHDRYYAMLEIPEDFSEKLVDVFGDDFSKPQIIYRVNEKSNAIASKITDSGAKTVTSQVTKAILEVVDNVVFSVGNHVGTEVSDNKEKLKQIRDVVFIASDHFGMLEKELQHAEEGMETLEKVLDYVDQTLPVVEDGIDQLQNFSSSSRILLEDTQKWYQRGADYLAIELSQYKEQLEELQEILKELQGKVNDTEELTEKLPNVLKKAEEIQNTVQVILNFLEKQELQDPEYEKWLEKLRNTEQGIEKCISLLEQLEQQPQMVQQTFQKGYAAVEKVLLQEEKVLQCAKEIMEWRMEHASTEEEKQLLQERIQRNQKQQQEVQQKRAELAEKENILQQMTPEEVAQNIQQFVQEIEKMRGIVQQAEQVMKEMQKNEIGPVELLQELQNANAFFAETIQQANSLLGTVEKGIVLAQKILPEAVETVKVIQNAMQDITEEYQNQWAGLVDNIFLDLDTALDDLNTVLSNTESALPEMTALLQQTRETEAQGKEILEKVEDALPEAKAELQRLRRVMSNFTDENIDFIIALLENDSDAAAEYFSSPVELKEERLYHLDNYGSAMAPFYTILALWVGCLLLSALLTTEALPVLANRENTVMEEYFGKMLTFLTLSIGQAMIVSLGDKFLLGVTVSSLKIFLGFSIITAIVFVLLVYSLVSVFGSIGKAMAVVLLVLQIAGSGGTYPVEVMPKFYQVIQPYLPFTYAIGAMREAISGPVPENLIYDFWHLILFGGFGLLVGIMLKQIVRPLLEKFNKKFRESGLGE